MSANTKIILIEGALKVVGIYNYNGSGYYKGNKNHKFAKSDNTKRDFTSSRCIRYELFKDVQPRQPAKKEMADYFLPMASSIIGLVRGYLSPEDELKRFSPLHVADAYTRMADFEALGKNIRKSDENAEPTGALFVDQGSSSKPKEKDLKNKNGEDTSDTSMFTQENAPERRQEFKAAINLKELQFLPLDDGYYRMVSAKHESEFVDLLTATFKKMDCSDPVKIGDYQDICAIMPIKRRGILLSQSQQKVLVADILRRIVNLKGYKAGASLEFDSADTVKLIASDSINTTSFSSYVKAIEGLNALKFEQFYTATK
jgi:hypothetical protein